MSEPESEKLLGRELIIRYTGILFTVSPLGNFVLSALLSGVRQWWRPNTLLNFAHQMNPTFWLLSVANLYAGILMMKGKRESWLPTLSVIVITIGFNLATFKSDIQDGWLQPCFSLLVNFALFGLIYSQEFHQRLQRRVREAQLRRPLSQSFTQAPPKAEFEGVGDWGTLTGVTHQGFQIHSHDGRAPAEIETREIEIELAQGLVLRARLLETIGQDYHFIFTNLTSATLSLLRRWARATAAPKRAAPGKKATPPKRAA